MIFDRKRAVLFLKIFCKKLTIASLMIIKAIELFNINAIPVRFHISSIFFQVLAIANVCREIA
jgi:hypothetical protein